MKVRIYPGALRIVAKSGVGEAALHQKAMLRCAGIEVTEKAERGVDIVHFNTVFPDSLFAAMLAHMRGQKIVWYGHSTMEDFRDSFPMSNLLAPAFLRWICLCYSQGDVIITPTPYSRKILKSYRIRRPVVSLSNGVDTDFFRYEKGYRGNFRRRYRIADDQRVVLSVGHYFVRKGILDFVRLAREMPDVTFFWFGYTEACLVPEEVRETMEDAPKNLHFPGYVSQEELRDAYCGCDLFCFMSHEETEGIVVLEALACETPTIVRDIPVYDDWLEDGENVYKAMDFQEFREVADDLLSGRKKNMRKAGRICAERRSIERVGRRLIEIYRRYL